MTNPPARKPITNAIEHAVYGVFGGVRRAAAALDVSTQALYQHLGRGYIADRETALRIERKTIETGQRVPAAELMQLEPWSGDPDPPKGRRPDELPGELAATGTDNASASADAPRASNVIEAGARFDRPGRAVHPPGHTCSRYRPAERRAA